MRPPLCRHRDNNINSINIGRNAIRLPACHNIQYSAPHLVYPDTAVDVVVRGADLVLVLGGGGGGGDVEVLLDVVHVVEGGHGGQAGGAGLRVLLALQTRL